MGCCCATPRKEVETDRGPRKCTDTCWLVLFGFCWMILGFAATWSFIDGNPTRLIRGYDSFGNICGQKNKKINGVSWSGLDMRRNPFVFHMNPASPSYTMKVCVSQCADRNMTVDGDLELFYQRTGSSLVRYDYDLTERNLESFYSKIPKYEIFVRRGKDENQGFGPAPKLPLTKQRPLLNRCVGEERIKLGNSLLNNVYSYLKNTDVSQKIVSDIYASWKNIVYTVAFGIGVSIVVTFTIHYLASIVSTLIMVISSLALIALTAGSWFVYFDMKYKLNRNPIIDGPDPLDGLINEKTFLAFSVLLTIISVIILTITFFMRSRIGLMVALFDETASCLRSMPSLIFQPIWTCSVLLIFLIFWTTVFLGIMTAEKDIVYNRTETRFQLALPARSLLSSNNGDLKFAPEADEYSLESVKHEQPTLVKYLWWFLIIMLCWSAEFILGCQQMTVASSVASWYFTRDKSTLSCPIGNSIKRISQFHLGSIACGSFLIVLFKIPRVILAYLDYYLKQFKDRSTCVNCTLKCCHCMWYCLENFIRYINHNAYTIVAIEGTPYCFSAKMAFQVMTSNTMRILTINTMGDFIIFLGKCIVTSTAAMFGVYIMRNDPIVHYLAVPVIFATVITYMVAHSMLCVYEMVIDTMFLCFVEDVNKSTKSGGELFAPESLLKFAQHDSEEHKTGVPAIVSELNVVRQPLNGSGNGHNAAPSAPGFVYPNLIESSH